MAEIGEGAIDACFNDIAMNIKKIRKDHDLTQKQMSKLLKIDTQYYSRLGRGDDPKRRFTLEKIILACALFNVTPNEIISKIPTGDENVYNTLEIQKDIKRGLKKLSPDKLKGLKDYINYIAVSE